MATAIQYEVTGAGVTLAKYDEVIKLMGSELGGRHPGIGCLFHWATQIPNGIRVFDVWELRSQFDQFATEKIGPVSAEAGLPAGVPTFFDVHNYLVGKSAAFGEPS